MKESKHSIFKIPLVREISLVLLIKLALVLVIKLAFFSDPIDMDDGSAVVSQHFGIEKTAE